MVYPRRFVVLNRERLRKLLSWPHRHSQTQVFSIFFEHQFLVHHHFQKRDKPIIRYLRKMAQDILERTMPLAVQVNRSRCSHEAVRQWVGPQPLLTYDQKVLAVPKTENRRVRRSPVKFCVRLFPSPYLFLDRLPQFPLMPQVGTIGLYHKPYGTEDIWREYGSIIRMVEDRL